MYNFFEMGFDGCTFQFRDVGYSSTKEVVAFLDMESALACIPKDLFTFAPQMFASQWTFTQPYSMRIDFLRT